MHNPEQEALERQELHNDAKKAQIRDALKQGPGFANAIASRMGEKSDGKFVQLLHEMVDDMELSFNWPRGCKL